MTMRPDHLFAQSDQLLSGVAGAGRQADKRRAVSTAYYAVFHTVARAAAFQLVGGDAATPEYAAIYRAVSHLAIARLCEEVLKTTPKASYQPYWPASGFDADMRAFAAEFPQLRKAREDADYDPRLRLKIEEARDFVDRARRAADRFKRGALQHRIFAALLLTRV